MSWEAPVTIFDDENEDELINEFVRLSAKYGADYSPAEIANEVFKGLRDPYPRSHQAAMAWSRSLAIKERIAKAKTSGNDEDLIQNRDDWEREMLALRRDKEMGAQEKKVQMEILVNIAKSHRWLDGEGDEGATAGRVVMNFIRDPRSVVSDDAE